MTGQLEALPRPARAPRRAPGARRPPTFARDTAFHLALRARVEGYFRATGRTPRDCWQMYVKTVVFLAGFAGTYALLVFAAQNWVQGLVLSVLLGLFAAGIGFNVQHDGGHQAYSDSRWVNALMALGLELLGGSSYLWRWKHGIFHHTYVNVSGHDTDINLGFLGRLTPQQPRLAFHRWQHLYLWSLYGLLVLKWQLVGDFQKLVTGHMGESRFPRPRGWDLLTLVAGKVVFFAMAFGVPLWFRSPLAVLFGYVVAAVVAGVLLSVVFQVAHCVEAAAFHVPDARTGRLAHAWAIHQVESTADFARQSRIATWLLGGLNFQIEHHLFPRISHVHYPALAPLVERTCREFGIRYTAFPSFRAGVASHFRWLRRMGVPGHATGSQDGSTGGPGQPPGTAEGRYSPS